LKQSLNGERSSPVACFSARICRKILAEQSNYFKVEPHYNPRKAPMVKPVRVTRRAGRLKGNILAKARPLTAIDGAHHGRRPAAVAEEASTAPPGGV
jgi:hypothetical protein